jgi:trigger factor
MQVSVESTGALEKRLTINVDEEQIDSAVQKKLNQLKGSVKLQGFRAGKVPMKVIQQRYGNQARQEVLGEVMQSSFYEAITQENLRPAGMPNFAPKESEKGKGFEYTATFEVYPEVEMVPLENEVIEKQKVEISESDIDDMLDTIRKQRVTWEEADKTVEQGDRAHIAFVGTIDGEPFEGGSSDDMPVEIGKGQLIAGFEDGLVGLSIGDQKTLDLTFPENYQKEELAGKPVKFEVTLNKVEVAKLPDDSELCKMVGVEDGNMQKLRDEVKQNMQRELDSTLKNNVKQAVMDKLLETHPIDIPQALIDNESQAIAQQMQQQFAQQGGQVPNMDASIFSDQAKRRVSLGLILSEIVKKQDIKADPDKVRERVEDIASPYEKPDDVVKWYYADKTTTFKDVMYPKQNK